MSANEVMITVIMPAYNAEKYIAQAIESVLAQDVPLELLVIDDCSSDATVQVVEHFANQPDSPVILVKNKSNMGAAATRNRGMEMARGKYIAFLDSDDWWDANKLSEQLKILENPEIVLCYTGRELMTAGGDSTGRIISVPNSVTYNDLLKTNSIPFSTVVVKTEVAREFYMQHAELHEDYIFLLSILKKYTGVQGINKPMLKSRLSEKGKSRNKFKSAKMQWGVYRLMNIGRCKAFLYFISYTWNGFKKYYG